MFDIIGFCFDGASAATPRKKGIVEGEKDRSPGAVIAIVDDDAAVCDSARFLLEAHDFEVRTYLGGAEFLRDTAAIACLIVDYQMPGLNGLDLVSELRERGNGVPTIMMTATADRAIERRAAELGIRQVLRKPLSNQLFLGAIRAEVG